MSESLRDVQDESELLRRTAEHFDAQTATLHLLGAPGVLHLRASYGHLPPPVLEAVRTVPVGKGIAGLTVQRGEPVDVCNLQTDASGVARPGARRTGVGGSICVPVTADGTTAGALGIGTTDERTFTDEEVSVLMDAAAHVPRVAPVGVDGWGDP